MEDSAAETRSEAGTSEDAATRGNGRIRPIVGFALLVLIASIVPIPGSAGGGPGLPFGVGLTDPFHLLGYAVLAWLLVGVTGVNLSGLAIAVLLATGYGFGIELVQGIIPWRTFAWSDVLLNAMGAAMGAGTRRLRGRPGWVTDGRVKSDGRTGEE
ncbi:VanZ family protein [Halorubrum vacuolatum]|uniref:VanZ like family protein n=1 Tax=Halorubrum vacuolatum TaxID=63740 RepID=A0A238V7X5_HALVU|nr:VanZ family protein [Halorubrum vacuolatum]SNR30552.1 VanZ like family protein [Halorubrum vacuolatum]